MCAWAHQRGSGDSFILEVTVALRHLLHRQSWVGCLGGTCSPIRQRSLSALHLNGFIFKTKLMDCPKTNNNNKKQPNKMFGGIFFSRISDSSGSQWASRHIHWYRTCLRHCVVRLAFKHGKHGLPKPAISKRKNTLFYDDMKCLRHLQFV